MEIIVKLIEWFKSVVELFKAFAAGFKGSYDYEDATL